MDILITGLHHRHVSLYHLCQLQRTSSTFLSVFHVSSIVEWLPSIVHTVPAAYKVVVGKATTLRTRRCGVKIPVGQEICFLSGVTHLLFSGYRCYFPGVNRTGPEVKCKFKKEWSHTSTPPICLHGVNTETSSLPLPLQAVSIFRFFHSQDRGSRFVRSVGNHLPDHTVSHPNRPQSYYSLM